MENKETKSQTEAAKLIHDMDSPVGIYIMDYTISYPNPITGRDEKIPHYAGALQNISEAHEGMSLYVDDSYSMNKLRKAGIAYQTWTTLNP